VQQRQKALLRRVPLQGARAVYMQADGFAKGQAFPRMPCHTAAYPKGTEMLSGRAKSEALSLQRHGEFDSPKTKRANNETKGRRKHGQHSREVT
jgi:hypothetical protein